MFVQLSTFIASLDNTRTRILRVHLSLNTCLVSIQITWTISSLKRDSYDEKSVITRKIASKFNQMDRL